MPGSETKKARDRERMQKKRAMYVEALREARRYVAYLAGDDRTFIGKGMPSECLKMIDSCLPKQQGEP